MFNLFKRKKWNCDISCSFRDQEKRARAHAGSNTQVLAENLKNLAKNFYDKNPIEALEAMQESFSLVVDISKLKWIGFKLNELGFIHESYRMLSLIPIAEFRSASEIKTYKLISNFVKNEVLNKKLDLNGTKSNEGNLISDELKKEDSNSNIIDIKHSKTKVIPNIELESLSSKPNNSFNCQSLADILSLTDGSICKPNNVYENIYVPRNVKNNIGKLYDNLNGLVINSSLDSQNFVYLDVFTVKYDGNYEVFSNLYIRLTYAGKLDIKGCFVFYDEQNKEICKPEFFTKSSTKITIPSDCFKVSFKLRVKGSGNISNLNVVTSDYPYFEIDIPPENFISNLSVPKNNSDKVIVSKKNNQIDSKFDDNSFDYITYNQTISVDRYPHKLIASVNNNFKNVIYCLTAYDRNNIKLDKYFISRGASEIYLSRNVQYLKISIRLKGTMTFSPSMILIFSNNYFVRNIKKISKLSIEKKLKEIKITSDINKFSLTKIFSDFIKKDNSYNSLNNLLQTVKVACIMDEFTWSSYSPEANMIQLLPDVFESQLETFKPDMIFIESAWRGCDNKWTNIIHKCPDELISILFWAKCNNVPTVFWNKEDPVHFETFKNAAALFDYIFTYDFNCVQRYKEITGRNNAFFLPMAVQPLMFNPIEKYKRTDAFCFAGSYYKKYIERAKDFDNYVRVLPAYKELVIFDRQYGKTDINYMMPDEYHQYIKGNLSYDEIDKAYKGYNYAINLNSIKQANSIARRVFELLACNTVTISNYSFGLSRGFGDLVITSDDPDVIIRKLSKLNNNSLDLEKFKLLGLRKVFSENTYGDRFKYILSKITNLELDVIKPRVALISFVKSTKELKMIKKLFGSLSYESKKLFVISNGLIKNNDTQSSLDLVMNNLHEYDYVGVLSVHDYYSQNYLDDLVNAFKYSGTDAVCKSTHYIYENNQIKLCEKNKPYTETNEIDLRCGLIKSHLLLQYLSNFELKFDKFDFCIKTKSLAVDSFNYCKGLRSSYQSKDKIDYVSDLQNINIGFSFSEMQNKSENLFFEKTQDLGNVLKFNSEEIYKSCKDNVVNAKFQNIKLNLIDNIFLIESSLNLNEYLYIPISREFKIAELPIKDNIIKLYFETSYASTLIVRIAYFFYDENKQKIFSKTDVANVNLSVEVPQNAVYLKFQIRLQSRGMIEIGNLLFDHRREFLPYYFDKNKILCLTNNYPSYDNLYKNAFVHTRLKLYKLQHIDVTVFQLNMSVSHLFSEFDSIDVIRGNLDYLKETLSCNKYKVVLVHFLDKNMYEILKLLPKSIKILVWCHGADILKYTRKLFNYTTEEALYKAKEESNIRSLFWQGVLNDIPSNFHFVFVSKYLKEVIEEDYSVTLPKNKYSIIHNPINTELFCYHEKGIEQRYKLLSIRPFASRNYANDLTVRCILELTKRHDFNKFEITIIGDGKLFDETIEPLKKFKNIHLLKKFLTQTEIYEYHKVNGIFLVPTREDTQGVSRDEAMSSGLIPVTNAVTAIPEFVDDSCGVLAPAEDYEYMAKKIGEIVDNPKMFKLMSKAASMRINLQVASDMIIRKEIGLILGRV